MNRLITTTISSWDVRLPRSPRIRIECEMKPVQGFRFKPTGFPSLGAAEYEAEADDGTVKCLVVESTQSMANYLEDVCMHDGRPVSVLADMPVITLADKDGKFIANTMTEAHRINSSYMLKNKHDTTLMDMLKSEFGDGKAGISDFARFLFKHDTATLLHGTWLPNISNGEYRITRMLSAFIDATGVSPAEYGGVKNDSLDSTGKKDGKGGSTEGYGNVPLPPIRDYTAKSITLYFSINLQLLRSYGLGEAAEEFMLALAVWKIRILTRHETEFRSGCDLRAVDITVTAPAGYDLPSMDEAEADLARCIKRCRDEGLFTDENIVIEYGE